MGLLRFYFGEYLFFQKIIEELLLVFFQMCF